MKTVKVFKVNGRYKISQIDTRFTVGVELTHDTTESYTTLNNIERAAHQVLGEPMWMSGTYVGWQNNQSWVKYSSRYSRKQFYFFESQQDWEQVQMMYALQFE